MNDRERWNEKYRKGHAQLPKVRVLMYMNRLAKGRALDVAAGAGETSVCLSLAGWSVVAVDLSDEAVRRAQARARGLRTDLHVVQCDARRLPFRRAFDTVICTHFFDRSIGLRAFLKPGGTLFFETVTEGLKPEYRLRPGELKGMFPGMETLLYAEEEGRATLLAREPLG